jgi:hypothetical protein
MGRVNEELASREWPPGTRVVSCCPLSKCLWQYEDPLPPCGAGATIDEAVRDALAKHFAAVEDVVRTHLETHPLLEWVQEVTALQADLWREKRDAGMVAGLLVRRLGGSAFVSDTELRNPGGTLRRIPAANGFILEVA